MASHGRPTTLLAVSKGQPISKIKELYSLGHRVFAENYVQELLEKAKELEGSCPEIQWHFIGHLQRNKVKALVAKIHSIHSVDSGSLAQELSKRWLALGRAEKLTVFLEVNIDGESSKSGVSVEEARDASEEIAALPGLELLGLMCVPSKIDGSGGLAFGRLRELEVNCRPFTQGKLSMGMSSDFELALHEGATHIRVGTLLFGERSTK